MQLARVLALLLVLAIASPSLNAQYSWRRATGGIGLTDGLDIEAHPNGLVVASSMGGVFVSTDHGTSWREATRLIKGSEWNPVDVAIDSSGAILLGGDGAIDGRNLVRSVDRGVTWSPVGIPILRGSTSIVVAHDGTIYSTGESRVPETEMIWSTDRGVTWDGSKLPGLHPRAVRPRTLLVRRDGLIIAAHHERGLLRSTDRGATWAYVHPDPATDERSIVATALGRGRVVLIAYGMPDSATRRLARSTDDGATFTAVDAPGADTVHSIASDAAGTVYVGTERGLLLSTDDGATWRTGTLPTSRVSAIATYGTGRALAIGAGGPYRTTDGGITWQPAFDGIGGGVATEVSSYGDDLIAVFDLAGLHRSTDDGETWTALGPNHLRARHGAITPAGSVIVTTSPRGLLRRAAGSATWDTVVRGDPSRGGLQVFARSIVATPDGEVLFSSFESGMPATGDIFSSTDDGATFDTVAQAAELVQSPIEQFAVTTQGDVWGAAYWRIVRRRAGESSFTTVLPREGLQHLAAVAVTDSGRAIVRHAQQIFATSNDGAAWDALPPLASRELPYAIAIATDGRIYAGTRPHPFPDTIGGRILEYDRGARAWREIGLPMPVASVNDLAIHRGMLVAATSHGVYLSSLPASAPANGADRAEALELIDGRRLRLTTSRDAELALRIIDARGARVASIDLGRLQPGAHAFVLPVDRLPSGVYLCVVESADGIVARIAIPVVR